MVGWSTQEADDITDELPPPPHQVQVDHMDPEDLLGAESCGSRGADEITLDFSLSVSHITNGTLSIGGTSTQCQGKHPPSKKCTKSHFSLKDLIISRQNIPGKTSCSNLELILLVLDQHLMGVFYIDVLLECVKLFVHFVCA